MPETILRLPAVQARLGLGRSTIYAHIDDGLCPKPVKLGARAVGWPSSEISAITAARVAGMSDQDIRTLVERLNEARTAALDPTNQEGLHALLGTVSGA